MMVMTPQNAKRFVEKVEFLTTPGWIDGGDSREKAWLPPNAGPYKVITDMAIMDFEADSKRMRVISLHPGVDLDTVKENSGFELLVANTLETTTPPTEEELKVLREEVDPYGYVIGR